MASRNKMPTANGSRTSQPKSAPMPTVGKGKSNTRVLDGPAAHTAVLPPRNRQKMEAGRASDQSKVTNERHYHENGEHRTPNMQYMTPGDTC